MLLENSVKNFPENSWWAYTYIVMRIKRFPNPLQAPFLSDLGGVIHSCIVVISQLFGEPTVKNNVLQICKYTQCCPYRPRHQTSSPPNGFLGGVKGTVMVRVKSRVGLVRAAQPSFFADLHMGSRHTLIAIEFTRKSNERCTFVNFGAWYPAR